MIRSVRWALAALMLLGGCERFRRRPAPSADAGTLRLPQPVSIAVREDGWTLSGSLVNGEAPGRAALLVHQLGSHRAEWAPLVQRLRRPPAITVLSIDLRGHGESTRGPLGDRTRWESFGTDAAKWPGVVRDVEASLRFLGQGQFERVVLVGSSIGASACISAAARSRVVRGVVMISPGLDYHGIDVRAPLAAFLVDPTRRVLALGGDSDAPAAEAIPALARLGAGRVASELLGAERHHGVSLCNADPARWDRVERFIREALDARGAPADSRARDGGR